MGRKRQPEVVVRTEWHKSESGCWSLSLGERGCRVRVTQRNPGGDFIRVTWIPGRGKSSASLRTRSRVEARARAEDFLRALLALEDEPRYAPPTLGDIWNRYQREARQYRRNTPKTRAEKRRRAALLLLGFGHEKRVEYLTLHDVEVYSDVRRAGVGWSDGRRTEPVGNRSVEADLQVLRAMLRWATTVRNPDGSWLLAEYPLRGLELPHESSPRRPILTYDRVIQVREAVRSLIERSPDDASRATWLRLDMAVVLAEATGRRIGSISQLRWSDIDFEHGVIEWRREADKKRRAWRVPCPTLVNQLREYRVRLGVVGDGWLFPQRRKDAPDSTAMLSQRLLRAEQAAGLPKLPGGVWHPFRRKWRTERKGLPDRDVMDAGGWADARTMLECYAQSDEGTLIAVMESPLKLRAGKISATG